MKVRPERDPAGHLQCLSVVPEMRETMTLEHWEQHHCPISTVAAVKASCPFYDLQDKGCASWLTPRMHDLKRHLSDIYRLSVADIKT